MGRPKAWLPFGEELMLSRVARILREVLDPVVVVAAPGQDVPPLPEDIAIVRDEVEGQGPLGGLAAGLAALEGNADAAYLSSCDVPLLKPGFVRRIIELLGNTSIAVPRVGGYHHPLAAVYRIEVLPEVRRLLAAERLRPVFLFDSMPTRILEPHEFANVDPNFDSLRNLNTPEDYNRALIDYDHQSI